MGLHNTGYLFREGIKSLWKNRTMSIASIAVLIACLLLTGIAAAMTVNLSAMMAMIEGNNTITVFLQDDLPSLTAVKIGEEIRTIDNISECTFKPKDVGLNEMMQIMGGDSGDGMLFNALQGVENPLPDAYVLSLADLSKYDETINAIKSVEGVDRISNYKDIADKLSNLDRLVRYCSVALVAVLGVVSLFIISNTVKVTMFSRRMEIIIMKSVGATNGFVRIPFIVEGLVIGVLSGLISATVLYFAYDKAVEVVYNIAPFLTIVDIKPYAGLIYLAYIVVGMLFGMLGGVISIGKYLKKEGEDAVV
ncbi:MAG: ABC transporter permease [Acutalibacter sp.]|nr:ABC transporter permease [Acutalibacter sp.]